MPLPRFDPFPVGAPDDPIQAVYNYLLGFEDVISLVGTSDDGTPYIYNGNIYHTMTGTQSCAVVVKFGGSWAAPNTNNTVLFPRIQVEVWSDPPRDEDGNVIQPTEARTRANAVWQQVNGHLHVPYNKIIVNEPTLIIFGSVSLGFPGWVQNNQSDHVGVLSGFYGLSVIVGGIDP